VNWLEDVSMFKGLRLHVALRYKVGQSLAFQREIVRGPEPVRCSTILPGDDGRLRLLREP
jgi:hypothetical protein